MLFHPVAEALQDAMGFSDMPRLQPSAAVSDPIREFRPSSYQPPFLIFAEMRSFKTNAKGRCFAAAAQKALLRRHFFSHLFAGALSRQGLLEAAFLTGFQVVGVTLHLFDDVFRLNLALETT